MVILDRAPLNTGQQFAQIHRDRPWLACADAPISVAVLHVTDRGDDSGRSAGKNLRQFAASAALLPLVDADAALLTS